MRKLGLITNSLALALLLFGCSESADDGPKPVKFIEIEADPISFTEDSADTTYSVYTQYQIGAGDVLDVLYQVTTWKELDEFRLAVDHRIEVRFVDLPELNENQQIRPDGTVSLPYLEQVYVVGKTVEELRKDLEKRYSKYLKHPEIYVLVPDFRTAINELKKDLMTAPRGLSRLVTVRPDGCATFAMLGDVKVAGRTIPEVNKELSKEYNSILPGLSCDLFLEKVSGSLVYVLGQVNRPGAYTISKPVLVEQAVALAGGATDMAKRTEAVVLRKRAGKIVAAKIDLTETLRAKQRGTFFFLAPDDVVYIPKRKIVRMAETARDIADILMFNGWSFNVSLDLTDFIAGEEDARKSSSDSSSVATPTP